MPDQVFGLSSQDARELSEMLRWWRSQRLRFESDPARSSQDQPTPEVYFAKTPARGVAPISGLEPGSAQCQIYRKNGTDGQLIRVDGLTKSTVLNLSRKALPPSTLVKVERDKFGTWFAQEQSQKKWVKLTAVVVEDCDDPDLTGTFTETRYRYTWVGGEWVLAEPNSGAVEPGCLVFQQDAADTNIAYEIADNLVPLGRIVEIEQVRVEELITGTGSTDFVSRWMFSAEAPQQDQPCRDRWRYFCVSGTLKEFSEDCDGVLTFVRNVGCCECTTTGTGTTPESCTPCPSPPATLCVRLSNMVFGQNSFNQWMPSGILVDYQGFTPDGLELTQWWTGVAPGVGGTGYYRATILLVCGGGISVHVGWIGFDPTAFPGDGALVSESFNSISNCTMSWTGLLTNRKTFNPESATASVSEDVSGCEGTTGTGGDPDPTCCSSPLTLATATITDKTGGATILPDSIPVQGGDALWQGIDNNVCPGKTLLLTATGARPEGNPSAPCVWTIRLSNGECTMAEATESVPSTCNPLSITADFLSFVGCDCMASTGTFTITITE